jgi:hypothetical protein
MKEKARFQKMQQKEDETAAIQAQMHQQLLDYSHEGQQLQRNVQLHLQLHPLEVCVTA